MGVTRAEVERIAQLAQLRLEMDEARRMTDELNAILDHMTELAALDVSGVAAYTNAADATAPLRADEPGADALHRPLADVAPGWQDDFFTVPRLAAQMGAGEASIAELQP